MLRRHLETTRLQDFKLRRAGLPTVARLMLQAVIRLILEVSFVPEQFSKVGFVCMPIFICGEERSVANLPD